MEGEVETIRALLKGETGIECKTAEALFLSEGEEETALVLFTIGVDNPVLFAGNVEGEGREESFVLLKLVKCVEEAVTALLILGGELVEVGR